MFEKERKSALQTESKFSLCRPKIQNLKKQFDGVEKGVDWPRTERSFLLLLLLLFMLFVVVIIVLV